MDLYSQLKDIAGPIIKHWDEDLTVHDKNTLATRVKPGQTWLWQVRPTGTWLVRWDEDPMGGSKDSFLEALIRQAMDGNWLNAQWHLIRCTEHRDGKAYGFILKDIAVQQLAAELPRPRPVATLPVLAHV